MTLSRRYGRLLPTAILVTSSLACGCANTSQYGPGRLAYQGAPQAAAGSNPFGGATAEGGQRARPARRTAQAPTQQQPTRRPGAMASTTWQRPQSGALPPNPYPSARPSAGSPAPAGNQTAFYETPAAPRRSAPSSQTGSRGQIQQMGYSAGIAAEDPFGAVAGQPATGAAAVPATSPTAPVAGSAPYQWGAPTGGSSEEFLPPIRQ